MVCGEASTMIQAERLPSTLLRIGNFGVLSFSRTRRRCFELY